ncbi:MAG: nicotinate-nucleotide--dimethylbenzimidazole phosphoribosyltransferase [Spirochaetes bacterium]|nr:nicotinate-nucleotide--dimethylbenzimidazole phosphoribosyltransferase [Spirochaetota bacterium]
MKKLKQTIDSIKHPDREVYEKALARLADQARPAGCLGELEALSARLAGIAGTLDVQLKNKIIVTCAGDHGVVEEGVSLFPSDVTTQMVFNFVNGGASVNVLARHAGARVFVADLGVNYDFKPDLPVFHKKIRKGTSNLAKGPAMTREEAVQSIEAGIEIVEELLRKERVDMLGTGDMGIGNTTPSSAIIASFSGIAVEKLTGRGTGLGDKALQSKIKTIKKALELNNPDKNDPIDVLAKIGGFEIGGLAGLVLGAAANSIPVVCDGLISTAGALIACELAPAAKDYLFASHRSVEAGHKFMHDHLGLEPILDLKMRLGEGTGAAVSMEILDVATRILAEIKTWSEVNIKDVQNKS